MSQDASIPCSGKRMCPSTWKSSSVDNGSTDNTLKILDGYGSKIKCYVCPDLPIAGLRNFGVEKTTKEWIAFVDADVEVDKYWAKSFIGFLEELEARGIDHQRVITGSTCLVPENPIVGGTGMVRTTHATG